MSIRLPGGLLGLGAWLAVSTSLLAAPIEREFRYVVTIDAQQQWKKNDPKFPGEQWSKGTATQRIELTTRLRSDGKLEVRNLLDPNLEARLEAKTIHLARQAKKYYEEQGKPFVVPKTPEEKAAFMRKMNGELLACNAEAVCYADTQLRYAAMMAAIDYPQALEEDTEPGRYLYFLPFKGCPHSANVSLNMRIDGVRYNKDVDRFVPFSETHVGNSIVPEKLPICRRLVAVIDTQNPDKPMYQETVYVPQPFGVTTYTELDHTSRKDEPQPLIMAAVDWMGHQLRHTKLEGKVSEDLPLVLPLNQNATWLGLWTGTAKTTMEWSFKDVSVTTPASVPKKKP